MKISFNIKYRTQWGQRMFVSGSIPELGEWDTSRALEMSFANAEDWHAVLELAKSRHKGFDYKYFTLDERNGAVVWEWGDNRHLPSDKDGIERVDIRDAWRPHNDPLNNLFTSAFVNALMRPDPARGKASRAKSPKTAVLRFQLPVPRIDADHVVCVMGSTPELGKWDPAKAVVLHNERHPLWQADVPVSAAGQAIEYKYGIYSKEKQAVVTWEGGANRASFVEEGLGKGDLKVLTDEQFRHPVGNWKGAGVAIPVFSIRSRQGMGVGEFLDLKLLVDWAKLTGLKLVQILPINDTVATHRWSDSYPYAAISVFALHPIYMNLRAMGRLSAELTEQIVFEQGRMLNEKETVDYEGVMKLKSRFFKLIYDEQKDGLANDEGYQAYVAENREWLIPYAVFSYFRDLFGTPNFQQWGEYQNATFEQVEEIAAPHQPHYDDVAIHCFIQYHLHRQLLEASEYARENGVVLKGDIPIGIYRHSVDAWMYRPLFNMECQAGAPPDGFSVAGQNWGFPTYNWDEMAKDGYQWWRKRLTQLSRYFDAFRIDHILGFFRIWEIPYDAVQGLFGHFNPSLPISRGELAAKGIWFDYDRFCKPYIREHFLYERFGDTTDMAKRVFLDEYAPGQYRMKPEFATQRQVEEYLTLPEDASLEERAKNERLKNALFSLIGEVLFFEAPFSNGDAFDPRCSMHFTRSYQELNDDTKRKLDELYVHYYYHRQESFWREKAMVKLPALKAATNMLICGEDLGMVPACVPGVMNDLGILSLAIQRMPSSSDREFWHPADTPYLSVCSPSCHDMSTVRGWWEEEDRDKIQRFYNNILGHKGSAPYFCEPWLCKDIVVQHLFSPSMWAIFPIQDLVGMDSELRRPNAKEEQINVPANPKHYWKFRFHLNMEDLIEAAEFNKGLKQLVDQAGRNANY
jgi:4-alpha-glucanotransferase